jgi:hypothetical protein
MSTKSSLLTLTSVTAKVKIYTRTPISAPDSASADQVLGEATTYILTLKRKWIGIKSAAFPSKDGLISDGTIELDSRITRNYSTSMLYSKMSDILKETNEETNWVDWEVSK